VVKSEREGWLIAAAAVFAAYMMAMLLLGGVRWYSPVPYYDMWQGVLNFGLRAGEGGFKIWWEPHVDHRLLLPRLIFWLDVAVFKGAALPLVTVNYLSLFALMALFCLVALERLKDLDAGRAAKAFLLLFLIGVLGSWMQHRNLTWGFQFQIVWGLSLSLAGFFLLQKSSRQGAGPLVFPGALFLGVLAAGTTANGVLTLPLMLAYLLAARQALWRILLALLLAATVVALHFSDLGGALPDNRFLEKLLGEPFGVAQRTLLLLGGPISYLFFNQPIGQILGQAGGALFLGLALVPGVSCLLKPKGRELDLALLCFLALIAASALAISVIRGQYGLEQSLSSRYMTLPLCGWAVLLLLHLPGVLRAARGPRRLIVLAFALYLMLGFGVAQLLVFKPQGERLTAYRTAALAAELGVADAQLLEPMGLWVEGRPALIDRLRQAGLSIFGGYPFKGLRESLGDARDLAGLPACRASLSQVSDIQEDKEYLRVAGRIERAEDEESPAPVWLLDGGGRVLGVALTGADLTGAGEEAAAFQGYLHADALPDLRFLLAERPACLATLARPGG
jgi:hypothetical protein